MLLHIQIHTIYVVIYCFCIYFLIRIGEQLINDSIKITNQYKKLQNIQRLFVFMLLFVFILNNKNLKRMCLSAFVTAIPRYFLNHYVLHSNPYNVSFRYIFFVQLSAFLICLFKYWVKSSDYTYLIFILFLKNLKKFRAT